MYCTVVRLNNINRILIMGIALENATDWSTIDITTLLYTLIAHITKLHTYDRGFQRKCDSHNSNLHPEYMWIIFQSFRFIWCKFRIIPDAKHDFSVTNHPDRIAMVRTFPNAYSLTKTFVFIWFSNGGVAHLVSFHAMPFTNVCARINSVSPHRNSPSYAPTQLMHLD